MAWSYVFYILIAILAIGILIALHELGHFLAAKASNVKVNEFAIGMGPKLWKKQGKETLYSLRLLPIGGFCAMEGEDEDSGDPRAFISAKWWKKLIILVAGSASNFLVGLLLMTIFLNVAGSYIPARIIELAPESALSEQGIETGDVIWSIDGTRIYTSDDLGLVLGRKGEGTRNLVIVRDGEKLRFHNFCMVKQVETVREDGTTEKMYGFSYGGPESVEKLTFFTACRQAWYECLDMVRMVFWGIEDLLTGRASVKEVGGIIKVTEIMVDSGVQAKTVGIGLSNICYITAFIAVNLAVMNMLPIPALDGGRVFLLLVSTAFTAITKKKIPAKYEAYIHAVGMVLLLALMAVIAVKDVVGLFSN